MARKVEHHWRTASEKIKMTHQIQDLIHLIEELGTVSVRQQPDKGYTKIYQDGAFISREWYQYHESGWQYESGITENFTQTIKKENNDLYQKITQSHNIMNALKNAIHHVEDILALQEEGSENYVKNALALANLEIFRHQLQKERKSINENNKQNSYTKSEPHFYHKGHSTNHGKR
jgi:hypothetical protein